MGFLGAFLIGRDPELHAAALLDYASAMNRQPTLQDDGVILTPLRHDEFDELLAVASDPLIWAQHPNPDRWKREVFRTYFEGALASEGAFMIRNKTHGKAIGSSRFYDHDAKASEIKIGYTFFLVPNGALASTSASSGSCSTMRSGMLSR